MGPSAAQPGVSASAASIAGGSARRRCRRAALRIPAGRNTSESTSVENGRPDTWAIGREVGDEAKVNLPAGLRVYEILEITYS